MSKIVDIKQHKSLGINPERAAELFAIIDKFAGYGFNKSHAAAYALLGWQTAWLKKHHPAAFYAAALTYVSNFDKLRQIVREAQDRGVVFLPPSPTKSKLAFSPERQDDGAIAVRWGLGSIKGLGRYAANVVASCHGKDLKTIEQLGQALASYGNAGPQARALADAGALDAFNRNRQAAGEHLATCIEFERNQIGQTLLFTLDTPPCPAIDDLPADQKREAEIAAIGISFHEHPLSKAYADMRRLKAVQVSKLGEYVGCGAVTVLARVESLSKSPRGTSSYARISDASAEIECLLEVESPSVGDILICDVARKQNDNRWRLVASRPYVAAETPKRARLDIRASHNWEAIRRVLASHGRGIDHVDIMIELNADKKVRKVIPPCFNITPDLLNELTALDDVISVREV